MKSSARLIPAEARGDRHASALWEGSGCLPVFRERRFFRKTSGEQIQKKSANARGFPLIEGTADIAIPGLPAAVAAPTDTARIDYAARCHPAACQAAESDDVFRTEADAESDVAPAAAAAPDGDAETELEATRALQTVIPPWSAMIPVRKRVPLPATDGQAADIPAALPGLPGRKRAGRA